GVLAAIAGTAPDAAAIRIRRTGVERLAADCARALDGRATDLAAVWDATEHRPLRAAVEALDPAVRARFDRLGRLFGEPPLPKSLRRLVRSPGIADAYALDLAARRVRRALGLLAVLGRSGARPRGPRRTTEPLLCALAVHTTCARPEIALAAVSAPRRRDRPRVPGQHARRRGRSVAARARRRAGTRRGRGRVLGRGRRARHARPGVLAPAGRVAGPVGPRTSLISSVFPG
ncbi:hypothetical protein, partial [Actinomadura sp. CNU-125]|uniref:hypothetical protein n=1 Tax=Actinomadura sp. CNU-125 TaxID=1904961 RepID=UPI0021CC8C34